MRLMHPAPVAGDIVMVVAALGILINGATALMFASGRKGDLNIRGAFLHMLADAVIAAGIVVTGLIIKVTGANRRRCAARWRRTRHGRVELPSRLTTVRFIVHGRSASIRPTAPRRAAT